MSAISSERDNILKLYEQLAQELDCEPQAPSSLPVPESSDGIQKAFARQGSIHIMWVGAERTGFRFLTTSPRQQ
jgi:hypothetical protein